MFNFINFTVKFLNCCVAFLYQLFLFYYFDICGLFLLLDGDESLFVVLMQFLVELDLIFHLLKFLESDNLYFICRNYLLFCLTKISINILLRLILSFLVFFLVHNIFYLNVYVFLLQSIITTRVTLQSHPWPLHLLEVQFPTS